MFVNGQKIYFQEAIIKYLLRNRDENVDIKSIPQDISFEEYINPEKQWEAFVSRESLKIIKKYPKDYRKHILILYKNFHLLKKLIQIQIYHMALLLKHSKVIKLMLPLLLLQCSWMKKNKNIRQNQMWDKCLKKNV